jgi:hypothetical protein
MITKWYRKKEETEEHHNLKKMVDSLEVTQKE